ncbi:MAG: glycosyltransferase family 2 protein [Alishewanella aestuarii]
MTSPMITALMTTFNSSDYVCQAIDSVLAQTYQNFQLLIVDDASTDSTCQLIENYRDPRICLIRQPQNLGVGATLARALQYIESPFIAKIDSDDLCLPERFAKQLAFMQAHPELDIVKCYFSYFTEDAEVEASERYQYFKAVKEAEHNNINHPELIQQELQRWNCMIHSCYFAKTRVIKKLDYFPLRVGEDYSLFYRAVQAGFTIGCVPEYLLQMRITSSSVTTAADAAGHFAGTLVQLKHDKLLALIRHHGALTLYGTGGLAIAVAARLIEHGLPFAGFAARVSSEPIQVSGRTWPVLSLEAIQQRGVVIAAQPVRQQVSDELRAAGWREWQDFMVIA